MNDIKQFNANDYLSFADEVQHEKSGLRGHVQVFRRNKKTNEVSLWDEKDNIIPISGYQWILMKMFGLYLDSKHQVLYEDISQDTTVVIPDLNNAGQFQIGVDPSKYSVMNSNISENHIIQGFMVGNGGAGEDSVTTKNTDYSFMKLRNPIPFQQTQQGSLDSSIAGKYTGVLRVSSSTSSDNYFSQSYYIKKFDETPHIYHSWYRDGQRWDYVDPVSQNDLGPDAVNGVGKTNRIETYCQCKLTISEDDCIAYFSHEGNTQTALINELGLVAYDTIPGTRTIVESAYTQYIKKFITIVFDNNRTTEDVTESFTLANTISTIMSENKISSYDQTNINNFINIINWYKTQTSSSIVFSALQDSLSSDTYIEVEAFYNQNGTLMYTTDKFLEYLSSSSFDTLSIDAAQRIKTITYYTFKSLPLDSNFEILFNYRIYTN